MRNGALGISEYDVCEVIAVVALALVLFFLLAIVLENQQTTNKTAGGYKQDG